MSLEALALSTNSWQLTTLNPYPSHGYPLTSMVSMLIWSCPVFSTLNVLFNVKFGSLSFKPKGKNMGVSLHLVARCSRSKWWASSSWTRLVTMKHVLVPETSFTDFSRKFSTLHVLSDAKVWSCFIFYIRVSNLRHEMNTGTLSLLKSKSNNPENKSGCFLKNLKYSSLICTCAITEILFLFLELFIVESKC